MIPAIFDAPFYGPRHIDLVIRQDAECFDGMRHIEDIPRQSIRLPDTAEVRMEMARLNRAPAADAAMAETDG